jgi:flagellar motor component MotA
MNTKNTERNMIKMANFIIGALVGLVLGFLIAYRTVTEMLDELDENDKEENANGTESKSEKT